MWGNPTLLNLLKKYWVKITNYWLKKVNIDTLNHNGNQALTSHGIIMTPLEFQQQIKHKDLLFHL